MQEVPQEDKEKELIDEELELTRTQEMLAKVLSENKFDEHGNEIQPLQQELYEALLVFTGNIPMHKETVNILARLLFMLSGDAAMSSVALFLVMIYWENAVQMHSITGCRMEISTN